MTVPSEQSQIQYETDGVSVSFPVPFRFIEDQHLRVTRLHDGASSVLVLGSDYSVAGANNPAGGTVTTAVAYPAGDSLSIDRIVPITQETHYQRNDPFPERAHEQALDKLTMIAQQQERVLGTLGDSSQVLRVPPYEDGLALLPPSAERANKAVAFDGTGNLPVMIPTDLPAVISMLDRAEAAAIQSEEARDESAGYAQDSEQEADRSKDEADRAKDEADRAGVSAGDADDAAVRAEAARDATLAASIMYDDTAAGLAATSDGDYFSTPGTDDTFTILYKNVLGVAVQQGKSPSYSLAFDGAIAGKKTMRSLFLTESLGYFGCSVQGFLPVTDTAYNSIGGSLATAGAFNIFTLSARAGDISGKLVTAGFFIKSNTLTPTSNWRLGYSAAGSTTPTWVVPASVSFYPVSEQVVLVRLTATMPAALTDHRVHVGKNAGAWPTGYQWIGGFYCYVGDAYVSPTDIEIFNRLSGRQLKTLVDDALRPVVPDTMGITTGAGVREFGNAVGKLSLTTIREITDIVSNGVCWLYPAGVAQTAAFIYSPRELGVSNENKWYRTAFYCHSDNGVFPTLNNVTRYIQKNGGYVDGSGGVIEFTAVSDTVRRYEVVGQFPSDPAEYGAFIGAGWAGTGGFGNLRFFGFMYAWGEEDEIRPARLGPISWIPKQSVVRGYQLEGGGGGGGSITDNNHPWLYKKIVWMGTSIPAQGGYPAAAGALMGANVVNVARSGFQSRIGDDAGVLFDIGYIGRALALDQATANSLYQANVGLEVNPNRYEILQPGSGVVLTQPMIDALLVNSSYEDLVLPHIDADLFVFDHGFNDAQYQVNPTMKKAGAAGTDQYEFTGSIGYIISKIYAAKMLADGTPPRFLFITHHNRLGNRGGTTLTELVDTQLDLAKAYASPIVNLADHLGLYNSAVRTALIPDGIHPVSGSRVSGMIAKIIAGYLREYGA